MSLSNYIFLICHIVKLSSHKGNHFIFDMQKLPSVENIFLITYLYFVCLIMIIIIVIIIIIIIIIITDPIQSANRPDIVIKDHKTKTCKLIDMAVPSDRNTSVKVTEKLSKYKDLELETSRMWGMRTETIPVIIGALGAIKKGLETYLGRIPGQISISELQKITLLGTAHILRRVLSN